MSDHVLTKAHFNARTNSVRFGFYNQNETFRCVCDREAQLKKMCYKDISLHAKFNKNRECFILEEVIPITDKLKIIFSVYQQEYQTYSREVAANVIVLPLKNVDYKVYIKEEVDDVVKDFGGMKTMNFNTYISPTTKRISANIAISNECDNSSLFTHYEIHLWVFITEPVGSKFMSKFVFSQ